MVDNPRCEWSQSGVIPAFDVSDSMCGFWYPHEIGSGYKWQ